MPFKRLYPRITDTEGVSASLRPAGRPSAVGRVLNLSEGGMLVAGNDLDVGETVDFELAGPDFRSSGLADITHRTRGALGLRFLRWQGPADDRIGTLIAARVRKQRLASLASEIPGRYLG